MTYCFKRCQRLRKKRDFGAVFRDQSKCLTSHFIFLVRANATNTCRLGVITSKKCSKLAVKRNRVRRLVREVFRCHRLAHKGVDIIVIAKHRFAYLDQKAQYQCTQQSFKQLAVFCDKLLSA